jgi:ABC-type antimicrobial peptide transport system permease subunit
LFGVTPSDPLTIVAVSALLLLVAMAASAVPAIKALRVDPVAALRQT